MVVNTAVKEQVYKRTRLGRNEVIMSEAVNNKIVKIGSQKN